VVVHKDAPRRMKTGEGTDSSDTTPYRESHRSVFRGEPLLCVAPVLCSVRVAQARERRRAYAGQRGPDGGRVRGTG
jgi:hypothetical protein